jgi:hypothetical protein
MRRMLRARKKCLGKVCYRDGAGAGTARSLIIALAGAGAGTTRSLIIALAGAGAGTTRSLIIDLAVAGWSPIKIDHF